MLACNRRGNGAAYSAASELKQISLTLSYGVGEERQKKRIAMRTLRRVDNTRTHVKMKRHRVARRLPSTHASGNLIRKYRG